MESEWFAGPIERPRIGILYRVGLAAVAVAMVLLPLVYLALVLAAAGSTLYLANEAFATEQASLKLRIFFPAAILIVGGTMVFFLFKPLFAPRRSGSDGSVELKPEAQPRLFAFVAALCEVVGAPPPTRIQVTCDVNASASLRRGLRSVGRKDLVLRIGLPLAASLDLRSVAGVLAHEFGHFAQGAGMGLTYVIRSVNAWFARVIHERDHWDESLEAWAADGGDLRSTVVGWFATIGVRIVRTVLHGLMWIGHGISCFALRQMEFDADRSEALVAGSRGFADCFRDIYALNVAAHLAQQAVGGRLEQGELLDDLPGLTDAAFDRMSDTQKTDCFDAALTEKTEFFATHPAVRDRVRAAHALQADGVFRGEGPARALFDNFDALCRETTEEEYKALFGGARHGAKRLTVAAFLADSEREESAFEALRAVFGSEFHPLTRVFPSPDRCVTGVDLAGLRERVRTLVAASPQALEEAEHNRKSFEALRERTGRIRQAVALAEAGGDPDLEGMDTEIRNLPDLMAHEEHELEAAHTALRSCYAPMAERLSIAMALVTRSDFTLEDDPVTVEQTSRIGAALRALDSASHTITTLLKQVDRVVGMSEYAHERVPEDAVRALFSKTVDDLRQPMDEIRERLSSTPLPFSDENDSRLDTLVPEFTRRTEDSDLFLASSHTWQEFADAYIRCMAHLTAITLRVEQALMH